ncbi:caspase family protein [Actinoplanes sp. NPDC051851]|uniref:caspase family protein n=1 Tax=Actinoplanes sp. NPDC051851 TaxID=3154753 RepID=UPI00341B8067
MTRKALLIGAETNGLSGVLHDVTAMDAALRSREFLVERLVTPNATRNGILEAYERLIADARPDDAVVLYYSGHGGRLLGDGPDIPFIVPDDWTDTPDDFRGITGVELSVLLERLTRVTRNTTVILDCCHASHMSRDVRLRIRSMLREVPAYDRVREHLRGLVRDGLDVSRRHLISNPHAVRVVACAPEQAAWEGARDDGLRMGLFTDALTRALRDSAGMRVSWATLIDAVRRRVQDFAPAQRPEAEGPGNRLPFSMEPYDPVDSLPIAVDRADRERIQVLGAPLLGVRVGDEFAVRAAGGTGPDLGTAVVDGLLPTAARAAFRPAGAGELPADARAYRTWAAAPALAVRLPHAHPATADLEREIRSRPLLRAAAEGRRVIAEVTAEDGLLVVRDDAGPLHHPWPAYPHGIGVVADNLQRVGQATVLRRLAGDPERPLTHGVIVEWGRVRDGREEPLPLSGGMLFAYGGERVFIRLRNDGEQAMYVSLIDVGVAARVSVLTASDLSGIRLEPKSSYTLGWNEDTGRLDGIVVDWPPETPRAAARPETVLALISDGPVDVGVLQQTGARTSGTRLTGAVTLQSILAQLTFGGLRDLGRGPAGAIRYAVQPIDFTVSPTEPPAGERAVFLVDDRPAAQIRLLVPRGGTPGRVAVRIGELIVRHNRALLGADIRVDAVVLTGGAGDQAVYRAETLRFSNVRDGDRLPLDDVLIYHGPAVDFLDIAVWVSRDTAGSLALGDLLEQKLTSPAVQAAGSQVAGLALAAPQAALAVAVVGAAAVLMNTAYELLTGVVGPNIGLYRTSLLAAERFGAGEHRRDPQDFSFTFSVTPVD